MGPGRWLLLYLQLKTLSGATRQRLTASGFAWCSLTLKRNNSRILSVWFRLCSKSPMWMIYSQFFWSIKHYWTNCSITCIITACGGFNQIVLHVFVSEQSLEQLHVIEVLKGVNFNGKIWIYEQSMALTFTRYEHHWDSMKNAVEE